MLSFFFFQFTLNGSIRRENWGKWGVFEVFFLKLYLWQHSEMGHVITVNSQRKSCFLFIYSSKSTKLKIYDCRLYTYGVKSIRKSKNMEKNAKIQPAGTFKESMARDRIRKGTEDVLLIFHFSSWGQVYGCSFYYYSLFLIYVRNIILCVVNI